jgi:hypothetical protein
MSTDQTNDNLLSTLKDAIVQNFNIILTNGNYDKQFEFNQISKILDILLIKIAVLKDKTTEGYASGKKYFGKFVLCNYKFIKENFILGNDFDNKFLEQFEDGPNKSWNLLHLTVLSYLSLLKQTQINDLTINYRGMIDKLVDQIELNKSESDSDSDSEQESDPDLKQESDEEPNTDLSINKNIEQFDPSSLFDSFKEQMPATQNTPNIIKNLMGDIKNILQSSTNETSNTKNIIDMGRDLSAKYQNLIESGSMDIGELLTSVVGLMSDPDTIAKEFGDLDTSKLPNPSNILSELSSDPSLKEEMKGMASKMMSGMDGMDGFSDMASKMMSGMGGMGDMGDMGDMASKMMSGMGGMSGIGDMASKMMSSMFKNNTSDSSAPKTVQELEKEIERMMLEVESADNSNNLIKEE